ncbi:DUF6777 domain-containing protein [Actinomadura parmotrematis]|uniref:DUF6777 domain-containing protein n=1 Tax=Actinomadura parmotrematis TaxID=2864039 RepID=A0ABS7FY95_9ACTN|nr:DUF6777 domain-containing protein [Actinomadura parmotrematis]MBW8485407.1 hypothetical protein [Actinomadura parmotrematis]
MRATSSRNRRATLPLAAALLVLAPAAGACDGSGTAAAITRLTVGDPGPDAFAPVPQSDTTQLVRAAKTGGTKPADTPGLYGGTRQASRCDAVKIATFLRANPAKARAWAAAEGITPDRIDAFLAGLTPVLLRSDTLVTNHGYADGKATGHTAVLQAGMGVLIDRYGAPVVKCNCGNPLTAPPAKVSTEHARYTGTAWPGFSDRAVTRIAPRAPEKGAVTSFVLVDPGATSGFERPAATTGAQDGPPVPVPPTATVEGQGTGTATPAPGDSGSPAPGDGGATPSGSGPAVAPGDSATPGPGTTGPAYPGGTPTAEPGTGQDTGGQEPGGDPTAPAVSLAPEGTPGSASAPGPEPEPPVAS